MDVLNAGLRVLFRFVLRQKSFKIQKSSFFKKKEGQKYPSLLTKNEAEKTETKTFMDKNKRHAIKLFY